jgi:hypothetical protein
MVLWRWFFLFSVCPWLLGLVPLSWQDSFLTRVELLALIETLNAELLSHSSATLTLERWCSGHGLAPEAKLVARLERGIQKHLDDSDRERLAVRTDDQLRYRHVRLFCGDKLLSEADNWYVPSLLTPEMNRLLDETDSPFGRVVRDLDFLRETLSAKLLWSPLPERWDVSPEPSLPPSASRLEAPDHILEHRAILRASNGVPFSFVVETYTRDLLAFPLPH